MKRTVIGVQPQEEVMSPRKPNQQRSEAVEAGKPPPPICAECGRLIVVGAATNDRWLCEYCLVVDSFKLT